jgi:hypothetical protein
MRLLDAFEARRTEEVRVVAACHNNTIVHRFHANFADFKLSIVYRAFILKEFLKKYCFILNLKNLAPYQTFHVVINFSSFVLYSFCLAYVKTIGLQQILLYFL